jgi:hypothetical protein
VQSGDVQAIRASALASLDTDFITSTVNDLKPLLTGATITVDSLFALDATTEPAGASRTDFFCGSPVVVINFNDLPPGAYALAILHATGVPKPQQLTLVLAQGADQRWMLGGFQPRPMTQAGHDGLWYWVSARKFAQKNQNWDAWFYYKTASFFLSPVDFLSSPNLEKLHTEQDQVKPDNLPGAKPLVINAQGSVFQVTSVDTTSEFGQYDLDVQYSPDSSQIAQLRDPPTARKQVTQVMTALLALHPELHDGFHGIWVHANQGNDAVFSLDLPMDQIMASGPLPAGVSGSVAR